jgi:hypothetical protein
MDPTSFKAPWGRSLYLMSAVLCALLIGIVAIGVVSPPRTNVVWIFVMVVLPLGILIASGFFAIRGYILTDHNLLVQRVGWHSEVDLSGLVSAQAIPDAMAGSSRTGGIGGLFSLAGSFKNEEYGTYRVFATDPKRSVVLRFRDSVVVVTPDDPAAFVEAVARFIDEAPLD